MTISAGLQRRLPALRHANYRRYSAGQVASIGGTWMQNVALAWLVYELTDSGTAVGVVTAAQFLPPLLLGAYAGTLADRIDGRRAVLVIQVFLGLQAAVLALVVFADAAAVWNLIPLALWQGTGTAFDQPIRQSLLNELVGDAELPNAIATNSALVQVGLIGGPALAGLLIETAGIGWCFAANAMSYALMFIAIAAIRPAEMIRRPKLSKGDTSIRAGLAALRDKPDVRLLLVVVAMVSLVGLRIEVILPVLAKDLGGESGLFSAMTVVRGVGALCSALYFASRSSGPTLPLLRWALGGLGGSLLFLMVPWTPFVLVVLFPAGLCLLAVIVSTLSMTQLLASPELRGRFVGLWFVVLNGTTVVGSLLTGALCEVVGPRAALAAGAVSMAAALGIVARSDARRLRGAVAS